jgi:hypothetical protein
MGLKPRPCAAPEGGDTGIPECPGNGIFGFGGAATLCLLHRHVVWDYALMSEHTDPGPGGGGSPRAQCAGQQGRREKLTTHQMRTIWQRRADAEEKLARHLKEARHTPGSPAAGLTPDA